MKGEVNTLADEDRLLLNTIRTGSTWTANTGYWAGHKETVMCRLCGEHKETAEHIHWRCSALKAQREQADGELAKCNPDNIPQPIKHPIAIAMRANPNQPFWGKIQGQSSRDNLTEHETKLFGCYMKTIPPDCRQILDDMGDTHTARSLTQCFTEGEGIDTSHPCQKGVLALPRRTSIVTLMVVCCM